MKFHLLKLFVVILFALNLNLARAQEFSQFRGGKGLGASSKGSIAEDFSVEKNLSWKKKIEGAGWAQPIVWNDKIILATAVADNGFTPKDFTGGVRMPESMGAGSKRPEFQVEWKVVCLMESTGELVWSTTVSKAQPKYGIHPSNSFATETPAADENGIYVFFGANGDLASLSHDGKLKWQRNLGAFKTNNDFGTGSSVVVHDGRVFVQQFTEETADLYCFDTKKGDQIWKASRESKGSAWSTPMIWKNKLRTELLVSGGMQIDSHNPEDGSILWSVSKVKAPTACSIFADEERIYFGGSDPMAKGPVFAVEPGAEGIIEPKRTNQSFDRCVWRQPNLGPGMATPVSNGEFLFLPDRNVLRCLNAETGEKVYENRLAGISMLVASPTVIGDSLILVDEKGTIGIVKAGKEYSLRIAGALNDTVWASPGVSKDALLIRGVDHLYRIQFDASKNE